MELERISNEIGSMLSSISEITGVEYAIFSDKAELLIGTPRYLQVKGSNVHFDSINEVLVQGNVIVHKPGKMSSCLGCRFVNNCPSTIELLLSVDLYGIPIGVVSMTSFSKEGHEKIEKNIRKYLGILHGIRDLIVSMAQFASYANNNAMLHTIIDGLMSTLETKYLIIDKNGFVLHRNGLEQLDLTVCMQNSNYIDYVIPSPIAEWVKDTKNFKQRYFSLEHFKGNVFLEPIFIEGNVYGYVIKMEESDEQIAHNQEISLDTIVSTDREIVWLKEKIVQLASSNSSILIIGDTGTGKELVARAIHNTSSSKDAPFIPINCANIPDSLFESELFGYEEGAFTGARKGGKLGILEMANTGTVFLDEIGELPLHQQAKLLRVLQDKIIRRVGGVVDIPVNMRIISATNQNLEELVAQGKFRQDLYYRINVIPFTLPPLSKRKGDIELLTTHLLDKHCRVLKKKITGIDKLALEALQNYSWPGNIRELENVLEYAVNMCHGNYLSLQDLPERFWNVSVRPLSIEEELSLVEKERLIDLLHLYGTSVESKKMIAKEMDISIRTLYRKMKQHKLS